MGLNGRVEAQKKAKMEKCTIKQNEILKKGSVDSRANESAHGEDQCTRAVYLIGLVDPRRKLLESRYIALDRSVPNGGRTAGHSLRGSELLAAG
jgi:hypothetical protein